MIRNGKLRHRLAIQSGTPTQGEYGEVTNAWATDVTVWGSVRPLRGQELVHAQQVLGRGKIALHFLLVRTPGQSL